MELIFEGVIVIDCQWCIEVINYVVCSLLGFSQFVCQLCGQLIDSVILLQFFFVSGDMFECDIYDELCCFNQLIVFVSWVCIMLENILQGWVIIFCDCNEINVFIVQLSQVKCYVDNLCIMCYEQFNWMIIFFGLLYMGYYDEVICYIQVQLEYVQELLDFIFLYFYLLMLCGLLFGKVICVCEKGVVLSFDLVCCIDCFLLLLMEFELIFIIGNLLDNVIEVMQCVELLYELVEVLIQFNVWELIIEVVDCGVGICFDICECIFECGVIIKICGDYGIGLYFIEYYVIQVGGIIEVVDNVLWGMIFILFILVDVYVCL